MKNERLYLLHILEASEKIYSYLPATLEEFIADEKGQDAVIKRLANITESASNLEDISKEEHPYVPWQQVRGMRNILVHDYLGDLAVEEIWKTVKNDLPILVEVANKILKNKYT